jgi:hypothetical protein
MGQVSAELRDGADAGVAKRAAAHRRSGGGGVALCRCRGHPDIAAKGAPYAGIVIKWFVAQVGNIGVLFVEFLLTVVLAAAMYANGEYASERVLRFGRRLAGAGGENAVRLAGQTIRGVALGIVGTALAQSLLAGIGLLLAGVPFAAALTAVIFILCIAQLGRCSCSRRQCSGFIGLAARFGEHSC